MNIGRKFILLVISSLAIVGAISLYLFRDFMVKEEEERLESLGSMAGSILEQSLSNYMMTRDSASLESALNRVSEIEAVDKIWITDDKGIIKAGTDKEAMGRKVPFETGALAGLSLHKKSAFLGESGTFRWVQGILNRPECHKCHIPDVKYNGMIVLDFSTKKLRAQIRRHILEGTIVILTALILIGLAMSNFWRSLVEKRLNGVIDRIRKFKEGEHDEHIPSSGNDEIARLEENFFNMAEAIRIREKEKSDHAQFLQRMIDTIHLPIFYKDANGVYQGCNKAFEAFLGLPRGAIVGKSVYEVASRELAAKYHEMDSALLRNPGVQVYESAVKHPDGSSRDVIFNKASFTDTEGHVAGLIGVMLDITDRKKAEEETRRNFDTQNVINDLLQVSLENVPLEGILTKALDTVLSIPWLAFGSQGAIFLAEEGSETLIIKAHRGLPAHLLDSCVRLPFGRCLCGLAASTRETQFAEMLDERHTVRYDAIEPHGHYCVPINFSDKVLGVISLHLSEGHQRDEREVAFLKAIANVLAGIIQRKKIEDERKTLISDLQLTLRKVSHSQRMWEETFDSIGDMISIHDSEFNIIKVNRAFASYFGLVPKSVINKRCYEFFHLADAPVAECPHMTTMRDNTAATCEYQDSRTKKIFLISTFPFYFHDANFRGSIHIAKDITGEKENEMRLIMSERLAALGQMASGIAHEINNPLAAIAGCAEGLLGRVRNGKYDPRLFENYLRIIEEEIMRCKGITTGMLSFVRKSSFEKRAFSLSEITDKTIELIGFQGRLRNVEVVKTYADNMPPVKGNEGELRQVILIIIMNALDAMGDSGRLHIRTGTADGTVFIEVTDSGVGIPPQNLSNIFDPFFTTKSDRGGTGLGLSIANKIVINHNGAINATSEKGQGSTFRIMLPMS